MSDYKWCHGSTCHKTRTQDRVRGSKGSKVLRTRKVKQDKWNQDSFLKYFCSNSCYNVFANTHIERIVALAPRNEPLETPIEDPTKSESYYGGWNITERGVDTQTEQDYKGYRKDIYMKQLIDKMYNDVDGTKEYKDAKANMTQRIHKATNPFSKQSEMLTAEEYAMWKAVMKANETADPNNGDDPTWDIVRKGITWFQKHNIKAYMTLLD